MKKIYNILLILIITGLFNSCQNEIDDLTIIKINPSFSILDEGSDKPMKVKSAEPTDTSQPIYGIQIYENDSAYYYGLFDDVSKMEIALSTGKSYKFKITAIKNGTGNGLKKLIDNDGTSYYLPSKVILENKFIKGNLFNNIDLATSLVLNQESKEFPEIDVFYSTKTITVEKGTTSIDFMLLRMGFGLTINIDDLKSGNVEVYLGNDTIQLSNQQKNVYTIRQFKSSNANFNQIHNSTQTYSDSIQISIKWFTDLGTIVSNDGKYEFKRNYQRALNLQLNNDSLSFEFEDWLSDDLTVTDIDGNVYKTVKIGNQIWMAENLKVTRYRDGTVIPNVTSSSTWASTSNNAWCNYNNDQTLGSIYGSLYNVHVVRNSKVISPEGWRVPTLNDWKELFEYLGGDSVIVGKKLIKPGTEYWLTDFGCTNETGFSILPSGARNFQGIFGGVISNGGTATGKIGECAYMWSSTIDPLSYGNGNDGVKFRDGKAYFCYIDKRFGMSIRCIKD